jgi:hypothetical protein
MNIKSDLFLFLSKSIRGIKISIISLLDGGFSDSLNKDKIIFVTGIVHRSDISMYIPA